MLHWIHACNEERRAKLHFQLRKNEKIIIKIKKILFGVSFSVHGTATLEPPSLVDRQQFQRRARHHCCSHALNGLGLHTAPMDHSVEVESAWLVGSRLKVDDFFPTDHSSHQFQRSTPELLVWYTPTVAVRPSFGRSLGIKTGWIL